MGDDDRPGNRGDCSFAERLFLRVVLWLTRNRVRVEGAEHLPKQDPVLIAMNHLNAFEALVAPLVLISLRGERKLVFLSDWMYFYMPIFGWALRRSGAIPVWSKRAKVPFLHLFRPARRPAPLKVAAQRLAAGKALALYPEGRRNDSPDTLLPGRPGLAWLALDSGVCIVPVGTDYEGRKEGRPAPRFPRLTIRIGKPLAVDQERAALAQKLRSRQTVESELTARVMENLARLSGKRVAAAAMKAESKMEQQPTGSIEARKVEPDADFEDAKRVVQEVYVTEKGWMSDATLDAFPGGASISWFIVRVRGEPAGLLRVVYDPPLEFPPGYRVELRKGVDWAALAAAARVAEVGRFMIREEHRRNPRVAIELMRAAVGEIVARDYTHLLTDVFEGDPHSPYEFHTRVLGFEEIGFHTHGELKTDRKRIILVLDIDRAYVRMRTRGGRFYRTFTEGYRDLLEARVADPRKRELAAG
jgi:1-acyl-sn-glycerol-3-phosphate acyltransferase